MMTKKKNTKFEKEVYGKYYAIVFSTCKRRLIQKDLIDDAVQSTFLLYIKEQDKIKSNLSTWFYWASKNVCIVMNRSLKDHVTINENLVESDKYHDEICLDRLIATLPKKKCELLLMRFYDDLSYQEISERTNTKEASIRKTIERTISFLQSKFKKKDVLVTALLAQLFHINKASASILNSSSFILQNSLIQQSIIKGVLKMYLITTLQKSILLVLLISLSGLIIVIGQDKVKKNNLSTSKTSEMEHSVPKNNSENIIKYTLTEGEYIMDGMYLETVGGKLRYVQGIWKGYLKIEEDKFKFIANSTSGKKHQYNGTVVDGKYILKIGKNKKFIGKLIKDNVISGSIMDNNSEGNFSKNGFFKIYPEKTRKTNGLKQQSFKE
ncbi:MAG: hypothetical protein COA79_18855 [Planctomycetota bacterium]|nr:MAG: hypothetical protein COA79_18855 [Planctomycetota bacterium]